MTGGVRRRLKGGALGLLVVLGVFGGVFALAGGISLLKDRSCDRLDAERVSHLMSGHQQPGPASIYVKGIGTDQSEILEYLEAEAAMDRAGCVH